MASHETIAILNLFVEEVSWDLLTTLAWNCLASSQDLNASDTIEERLSVEFERVDLILIEAVLVCQKQVDLVLSGSYPLNVAFAFLVVLEALIRLAVTLQPVSRVEDPLWLEDLLSVSRHVSGHCVVWEVCLRADSQLTSLLGHDSLDVLVLDHAGRVLE